MILGHSYFCTAISQYAKMSLESYAFFTITKQLYIVIGHLILNISIFLSL